MRTRVDNGAQVVMEPSCFGGKRTSLMLVISWTECKSKGFVCHLLYRINISSTGRNQAHLCHN